LTAVAAACGSDEEALIVYSGRSEDLIGPLLEEFTATTGTPVAARYGQSADLALLIQQEGERSPADVFISQSPGAVGLLSGEGSLKQLSEDTTSLVGEPYRNGSGYWVGLSGRVRVLVYNSELVPTGELPASVFDLVDDRYRGRVALAPANGSFQDFVTGMREIHGDEATQDWLDGMERNDSPTYANNSSIVQAVGRGEVDMGLVNHYYNLRALNEDPSLSSVNHFFGDVGSLVIITAGAVPASSDRSEQAEELLRYLLSRQAQLFLADGTFEYPLALGDAGPAGLPSLAALDATTYDFETLSGGLLKTKEMIDASGLEEP
jgi:iron(III) transport system substrate-binding protein